MNFCISWASQVAQMVKNPPAILETQEMWVRSLGWEDPLEKRMATHSSILAWEIPWTEEPGRLQSMGSQRVRHSWAINSSLVYHKSASNWSNLYPKPWYKHHPQCLNLANNVWFFPLTIFVCRLLIVFKYLAEGKTVGAKTVCFIALSFISQRLLKYYVGLRMTHSVPPLNLVVL